MSIFSNILSGWFGRKKADDQDETSDKQTVSASTGGEVEQEPVVVWEAANLMEAQIIVGRLKTEGIPAIMSGEAVGSIYGFTSGGLAQTDVLVPGPLAERATDILNSEVEWDEAEYEENENENEYQEYKFEETADDAIDSTDQADVDK